MFILFIEYIFCTKNCGLWYTYKYVCVRIYFTTILVDREYYAHFPAEKIKAQKVLLNLLGILN